MASHREAPGSIPPGPRDNSFIKSFVNSIYLKVSANHQKRRWRGLVFTLIVRGLTVELVKCSYKVGTHANLIILIHRIKPLVSKRYSSQNLEVGEPN